MNFDKVNSDLEKFNIPKVSYTERSSDEIGTPKELLATILYRWHLEIFVVAHLLIKRRISAVIWVLFKNKQGHAW